MMEYNIKTSENRSHIVLTIVGEITAQLMMKAIIEAHTHGNEIGIDRYLVNATKAKNMESIFGNYNFAYSDMKQTEGINPKAKVAALISSGDKSHDFVETTLHNTGRLFKLFTDIDKAKDYLKK